MSVQAQHHAIGRKASRGLTTCRCCSEATAPPWAAGLLPAFRLRLRGVLGSSVSPGGVFGACQSPASFAPFIHHAFFVGGSATRTGLLARRVRSPHRSTKITVSSGISLLKLFQLTFRDFWKHRHTPFSKNRATESLYLLSRNYDFLSISLWLNLRLRLLMQYR